MITVGWTIYRDRFWDHLVILGGSIRLVGYSFGKNSKRPSITNCTERAAKSIPKSLVRTSIPVLPNSFSILLAAEKKTKTVNKTKAVIKPVDAIPTKPGFAPAIKITVAIAPGPIIKGIANGNTDGSSTSSCSVWFSLLFVSVLFFFFDQCLMHVREVIHYVL